MPDPIPFLAVPRELLRCASFPRAAFRDAARLGQLWLCTSWDGLPFLYVWQPGGSPPRRGARKVLPHPTPAPVIEARRRALIARGAL
jgi:hypothetical protein